MGGSFSALKVKKDEDQNPIVDVFLIMGSIMESKIKILPAEANKIFRGKYDRIRELTRGLFPELISCQNNQFSRILNTFVHFGCYEYFDGSG
jgi:hypothetical protein